MTIDEVFPSRWLHAADLQGRSVVVKVESVTVEEVRDPRTFQPVQKIVVAFVGAEKKLIPNKTQFEALCAISKADTARGWQGKRFILSPAKFRGKDTIAVSAPPINRNGSGEGEDLDVIDIRPVVVEAADTSLLARDGQVESIHAYGKGLYGAEWPQVGRKMVEGVTGGRSASSRELTQDEAAQLIQTLKAEKQERERQQEAA